MLLFDYLGAVFQHDIFFVLNASLVSSHPLHFKFQLHHSCLLPGKAPSILCSALLLLYFFYIFFILLSGFFLLFLFFKHLIRFFKFINLFYTSNFSCFLIFILFKYLFIFLGFNFFIAIHYFFYIYIKNILY